MALQKTIIDTQRGIAADYFRLTSLVIDLSGFAPRVQAVLSGYASAGVRAQPDGAGIALRQYTEIGAPAVALMRTPISDALVSRGLDLSSLPAEARALIASTTIYDLVAQSIYSLARMRPADSKQEPEFTDAVDV